MSAPATLSNDDSRKPNKKKLENLERLRKKKEGKVSKKRLKKMAQIVERKKRKETRDSLIEKLMKHQLDSFAMEGLISTSKRQNNQQAAVTVDGNNATNGDAHFPKKLRCVSGEKVHAEAERAKKRVQSNHYETDSSSSDEEVEVEEVEAMEMEAVAEAPSVIDVTPKKAEVKPNKKEADAEAAAQKAKQLALFEQQLKTLAKIKGPQVAVARLRDVEKQRMKLPVHAEEQPIVEAINENPVVIICGETGSGKTTQVPQFLYEAGYTSNGHLIGITEPRRVAAISMANRVGQELNDPSLASYQIRFEGNRSEKTRLLFMTDGVLLRELQADATLSRFSAIVIDEAHERSIYSDVLIGLLSRICIARLKRGVPLKLIIMSATLRLEDFLQKRLFPSVVPKVLNVSSRQFPVTEHFERHTPDDHLQAAFKKVCRIHERLPAGGILVFLSGQREVEQLVKWLNIKYPSAEVATTPGWERKGKGKRKKHSKPAEQGEPTDEDMIVDYEEFGVDDVDDTGGSAGPLTSELPQDEHGEEEKVRFQPVHCLPLYSLLPSDKQQLVFKPVPEGMRLCVVATNVAETSLTIPNIRYVVDSGKEKRRHFDPITGVSQFLVGWISKASADQRAGRAGRVQAGHAYRLYSSAVYEDFTLFSPPEILNKPIEQLVLHLKAMNFSKLINFPFPTPPQADQLRAAELSLTRLGALETATVKEGEKQETRITEVGRTLVQIPLSPSFSKLLVLSNQHSLLPYVITLVSALSVREPMLRISTIQEATPLQTQEAMAEMLKQRKGWCSFGEARHLGDLSVILHALGVVDHEQQVTSQLMRSLGLRPKALGEIRKLRRQLTHLVNSSASVQEKLDEDFKLEPPTQKQMRFIRQILASCLPEQIAQRVDPSNVEGAEVPKKAYRCQRLREFVFIDSTSMLFRAQPDFVLYQDILQIGERKCMQNLVAIEKEWVPDWVTNKLKLNA